MAYSTQTWTNGSTGGTPLSATRLNHIETGLTSAANVADGAATLAATKLGPTALADVPRFLVFTTIWPARPNDDRRTFFLGGDTGTDAPADPNLRDFDVWIPES